MNKRMNFLIALLSVGLCFQSCSKDNFEEIVRSQNENQEPEKTALGTITIDAYLKDVIKVTTGKALTLEEALDVMLVEITNTDGNTIFVSENYRDLPSAIELEAGTYSMLVSNFPLDEVRFDNGVYGDYIRDFEITIGNNTELSPVLTLLDVATTVNFSNEILTAFPDISVYVARTGLPAAIFTEFPLDLNYSVADNGRRGYHSLFSGNHSSRFTKHFGELFVSISATNSAGEQVQTSRIIENMSGNKHYSINIEMTDPTSASLNVTLEPEEENTETITFPN